jgi:hypothetical protein
MSSNQQRAPIGTRQKTGETCRESGKWKSDDHPSTTAPIAKGNTMPPHSGKAVYWILMEYV